jgi:hemoglobin
MKKDIVDRKDIELLVDTFYTKVRQSKLLAPIFEDISKIDWNTHLPKMYSFWASLLLAEHSFSGNPMLKHIELSKQATMTDIEFIEWLYLFSKTIDELFEGEKAEEAKARTTNIGRLMLHKIQMN